MAVTTQLPAGTALRPLQANGDGRGAFTELYREEWGTGARPIQWNAVWSEAGVLRGVHVHIRHDDYLTVPVGRASVGLRDLRRGSPTEGLAVLVELGRERPAALVIPHGVAHGFYFHEPSLHVYAVSEKLKLLEEEGDAVYHDAMGALFAEGGDALEVIKWKDLYDKVEDALDQCEDVGNVLQSIALKNA
jgi:dTDP-4-dehydrorhamnose 3,5-epimerase